MGAVEIERSKAKSLLNEVAKKLVDARFAKTDLLVTSQIIENLGQQLADDILKGDLTLAPDEANRLLTEEPNLVLFLLRSARLDALSVDAGTFEKVTFIINQHADQYPSSAHFSASRVRTRAIQEMPETYEKHRAFYEDLCCEVGAMGF